MLGKRIFRSCLRAFSTNNTPPTKLGIIGVPFAEGQSKAGVEKAPDLLRAQGLLGVLEAAAYGNLQIRDYGNLQYAAEPLPKPVAFGNMKNYGTFISCNKALIKKITEILKDNDRFLTLGGDHAIGFGSVAGHLLHTPDLSVVWVDAHADINLHCTSGSGNIHGMPVSLLLKELRSYWQHAKLHEFAPNCLRADQLVYIGLRDVDPYEAYIISKLGIRAYAMDSIDKYGIAKVIEMTLDALEPHHKIHVSFDVDAFDGTVAPSTGTIVHGGLTLREGISIVEALSETRRVQGIDLVELNPNLGSTEDVQRTVAACFDILKTLCSDYKRAGNYYNIDVNPLNI